MKWVLYYIVYYISINVLYYTLIESLIFNDEKEFKVHVKNGVLKEEEQWQN